jgi:hypothetical protein
LQTSKYNPQEFTKTSDRVRFFLKEREWYVEDYGVELAREEFKRIVNAKTDVTGLYIRTRPDLFGYRFNCNRWLIECKDYWGTSVPQTGNYSIEAFPWFFSRHMLKAGVNICYAIDDPLYGLRFFQSNLPPFSQIKSVIVPPKYGKLFRETVAARFKQAFNFTIHFEYRTVQDIRASQDPFILVPRLYLSNAETGDYFSRFAQIRSMYQRNC